MCKDIITHVLCKGYTADTNSWITININISAQEGLYVAQVQKLIFDKLRYY
jgi:hypothetical protein